MGKTKNKFMTATEIENEYALSAELGKPVDTSRMYNERADVENGSWVMIIKTIPVEKSAAPKLYGIYWGMPKDDEYGRQVCVVHTKEDVTLLNHEYVTISEEKLQEYREIGYTLHETTDPNINDMDLKLIEKGRNLCEEEREVIWALQLDGLTETQACEEYFLSKHTDRSNMMIWYYPTDDLLGEIWALFGDKR